MPDTDINTVEITGTVQDRMRFGETNRGLPCCSFWLECWEDKDRSHATARVKVNVYGGLVSVCEDKLTAGVWVGIQGKLMNRRRPHAAPLIEVRAENIAFKGNNKS